MNFLAFLLIISASLSVGASTIEEIVVTADLKEQSEIKIASSIFVVSEEAIATRGAMHLEEVLNSIPNLNFASGSNRPRFFQIRGVGERSQFGSPVNASVGFLVDDIDFSGAGTIASMLDVEQIEVLRGPQGTRYGASALGGLIKVKTKDPSSKQELELKITHGQYATQNFDLIMNTPVSDQLLLRAAFSDLESDGYMYNQFLDRSDANGRNESTSRIKMRWLPSNRWVVDVSLANTEIDNGYDTFSLDNNRVTLSDEPGFDRQKSKYASIKSKWLGQNYEITTILGAANSDIDYGYDEDWSFTGIHPFGYTSTDRYLRERKTRSAELRINSLSEFSWVAGFYFFDSSEDLLRDYTFLTNNFSSNYEFKSYAVFAESEIELSEGTSLLAGVRFEKRKTNYKDSEGIEFSPSEDFWGGEISLNKDLSDNLLGYVSIARGFKAGGFNIDGTLDSDLREFNEEYLIEYETGLKGAFFRDNLQVRLAIFMDDRRDQQVKSSLVRPRSDGSTEFIDFLGNAAAGTNKGLEGSIVWELNPNWRLTLDAGLLRATFDEYINEFGENLSGRDQAHAPSYMASAGIRFAQGRWTASLKADTKDEFYFSDRHGVRSERATLANFSVEYSVMPWQFALWARNLGDENYQTRGFGSFGNDPRKLYVTEPYYQLGEPRIVGVTFQYFMRK